MQKTSHYRVHTKWASTAGTVDGNYDRTHTVVTAHKPGIILTTANPVKGDPDKLNPEDLLVASVSSCHMLTYLYLCATEGIVVTAYADDAIGTMTEIDHEKAFISEVKLNPVVIVTDESMVDKAIHLHEKAHSNCIIANSVKFEILNNPVCKVK